MEDQKNKQILKTNRQRYFHILINLRSIETKISLNTMPSTSLADLLLAFNFVSQKKLEKSLYDLKIIDRGRLITVKNFEGQLESNSQGVPYWNIYLQTTALITRRCLAKAISKEFFKTKNSIDPTITINLLNNFQQCDRGNLFSIPESDFYPGYFSRTLLKFEELLKTKEVQEKYQI